MQLAGWPTVAAIGVAEPQPGLLELVAISGAGVVTTVRCRGHHLERGELDHRPLPSIEQHEPDD